MFSGLDFTYDGVSSSTYGLKIMDFEGVGKFETNILSSSLNAVKPADSRKFFRVGSKIDSPPQFQLTVVSETALNATSRRPILAWLYNRDDFKIFTVSQSDLTSVQYRCIFTNVDLIYINGKCYGLSLTGVLDSQYQIINDILPSAQGTIPASGTLTLSVSNQSDKIGGYLYPYIRLEKPNNISVSTYQFRHTNSSLYNKFGKMTLEPNFASTLEEAISIDCQKKTISSSHGIYNISGFSGNWIRVPADQSSTEIQITGSAGTNVIFRLTRYVLVGF